LLSAPDNTSSICLVDDDPSVLRSTGRLLASAGWQVESFLDPLAFLEFAKTYIPKVVILDIIMPIMNGLEVQRRLRVISPSTRVIVLTSKDDPVTRSQAMDAGASAFFLKPITDDLFLAGVETAACNT
jgi:FixJ family two-component response regulator